MADRPLPQTQTVEVHQTPAQGDLVGVLLVTSGEQVGRVVSMASRSSVTLGRAEECEVCIDDPGLSRSHAQIQCVAGKYLARDLGSRNGTFLNDERIDFVAPLEDGDRVRLGAGVRLQFSLVEPAAAQRMTRAFEASRRLSERIEAAPPSQARGDGDAPTVVTDPAQQALYDDARRAARSMLTVLVTGETGVGKDVLARAIHFASPRAKKAFLALNCAAFSESLLESELFGHEKGAFTGASGSKAGLLEAAEGGTVFLDEVGELPLSIQAKMLRVLEARTILPIGARAPKTIDVRFVAATNRDLEASIADGTFRRDLYYRLAQVSLRVPPLRERPSEIRELATWFAKTAAQQIDRSPPSLSDELIAVLSRYPFPGNVRELRNIIERAVVMTTADTLLPEHLPAEVRTPPRPSNAPEPARQGSPEAPLRGALEEIEKARILKALADCGHNQSRAAELLGMPRRTLVTRLSEWGLTKKRPK